MPLTEKGKKQIKKSAKILKNKKIDLIFSSDILRTRQTAEMVSKELEISPKYDKRLREYDVGFFNGKSIEEFRTFFKNERERFIKKPDKGETYTELSERIRGFIEEIEKKYFNKNILIISHKIPLTFFEGIIKGFNGENILKKCPKYNRIKKGEIRKLIDANIRMNANNTN